jgi:hypothetical protein
MGGRDAANERKQPPTKRNVQVQREIKRVKTATDKAQCKGSA